MVFTTYMYCGAVKTVVQNYKTFVSLQVLVPDKATYVQIRLTANDWKDDDNHYCIPTENQRIFEHTIQFTESMNIEFTFCYDNTINTVWSGQNFHLTYQDVGLLKANELSTFELSQDDKFKRFFYPQIKANWHDESEYSHAIWRTRTQTFGWAALPNENIWTHILSFLRENIILEIFAGNGFWASVFKSRLPYTSNWILTDSYEWTINDTFVPVEKMLAVDAIAKYPSDVLIMIWPPYETTAYEALRLFTGSKLMFVGCIHSCADSQFYCELKQNWRKLHAYGDVKLFVRL